MAVYEVPLTPTPQKFFIQLGATTYRFTMSWNNAPNGGWILDIASNQDVPILYGLALVTGANLLAQYDYLDFDGGLVVQTDYNKNAVPTFQNLGVQSHLYFLTGEDIPT